MKNILFLDDDNFRHSMFPLTADRVHTAEEAIKCLQKSKYEILFLDHDLGGEVYCNVERTDTGSEVARWLVANKQDNIKLIVCHSHSIVGSDHMVALLSPIYNVQQVPFVNLNKWVADNIDMF